MAKLRIGALVSGRGSNLQALIDACGEPGFPAEIAIVVSNVADAMGLDRATLAGLPTAVVDHSEFDGRESFEAALNGVLEAAAVELICLAGFMRLLTDGFVGRWQDRLINVHPSLLPAFKGLHVHERVLEAGVRFSGCTIHFVRPEMDTGPIIVQAVVPVRPGDNIDTLAAKVLTQEHRIYPLAVRLIAEGRVSVVDERVAVEGAAPPEGALINPGSE